MSTPPPTVDPLDSLPLPFSGMARDALPSLQATHANASKRGAAGRPGGLMAMVVADPQTIRHLGGQAVVVASRTWVLRGLGELAHQAARHPHGEEQAEAMTRALAQLRLPPVAGHLRTALIGPGTVRVVDMPLSPVTVSA